MSSNTNAGASDAFEKFRETTFAVGLLAGMAIFALGMAFLILTLSMDTTPPAPYFTSSFQKYLTLAASIGGMVGGALVVKGAAKVGGW